MRENGKNLDDKNENILNIMQKFGKYQIIQYFLICLPTVFTSMNNVNYVFVAGDIDYRCRLPECESLNNTYSAPWWPTDVDRCFKPIVNDTYLEANQCTNTSFTSSLTECKEWIYGSNDTIVSWKCMFHPEPVSIFDRFSAEPRSIWTLDLACQPWKTNFVGTIHSLGTVLGMMIGGWCSDRFGRKPTQIVAFVGLVIGTIKTLTKSYDVYIFIELVEATLSGAAFAAGMILIIEISGNDKRVLSGVLYAYAIYTGEALLAVIAILVPYWKTIVYIICVPPVLFISYIRLTNESLRWQILNDKLEEAKATLKLIVKLNNINIKHQDIDNIDKEKLQRVCSVDINAKKEGFKEVFKSKEIMKRLIVAILARFSATLIYYGLVVNSVWLSGNKYTNYIVAAVLSFPGDLMALFFMEKIGRKWPLIYGFLISGITCIAFAYVPESLLWLKLLLFFIAKLVVTACYTGILAYTMELFPTSVRGLLFGLCSSTASVGWMIAPLTPAMDTISPVFASSFFGCSAILASLALTLTPETKDLPLVGTIEEAGNRAAAAKNIEGDDVKKEVYKIEFEENGIISVHL